MYCTSFDTHDPANLVPMRLSVEAADDSPEDRQSGFTWFNTPGLEMYDFWGCYEDS